MVTEPTQPNSRHVIEGLGADGPDPNMREKLMLFGQFVGDWDIVEARYIVGSSICLPEEFWHTLFL
jgi:hypothetical protein